MSAARKRESEGRRKTLTGTVVSDKMDKTVVVRVERRVLHGRYKKYVKKRKKYMAHDENNECRIGDVVKIMECRPLSKHKCWRVVEILRRAEAPEKAAELVEKPVEITEEFQEVVEGEAGEVPVEVVPGEHAAEEKEQAQERQAAEAEAAPQGEEEAEE